MIKLANLESELTVETEGTLFEWMRACTPDADLASLAENPNALVRLRVALNSSTPIAVLSKLCTDSTLFVREVAMAAMALGGSEQTPSAPLDGGWALGGKGPAGGVIFFDAGHRHWWGRYLEAAADGWAIPPAISAQPTDPQAVWGEMEAIDLGTMPEIGWGLWNTWRVILHYGKANASGLATTYRGGNRADWFLPSVDELVTLAGNHGLVGAFSSEFYWSSTQREIDDQEGDLLDAWHLFINDDPIPEVDHVWHEGHVRPIRAF